ncbi:MAG: 4-hydroxy-tetrahydrodipicolinate synthase [Leptothrix sp. (in: Bacteria)]|nr:4-hydroxy-tetrahydrodipicolinate synthase [Leptothrix sp. (in: b-proteobacteria)]
MFSLFSGIWVPLVTPFQNGAVDHAALRRLVGHCVAQGVHGLAPLGTTGEPATLDDDEQLAVLDTVLEAAQGLPVMVGLAGVHQGDLQRRLKVFATRPVAGVMVPAPAYVRPTQQGITDHFTRLADASPVPLVLYDIPYRTGVEIQLDTLLSLAAHPNIRAIKDCGGSPDKTQALIADGRLAVLSGEDAAVFSSLCMGGHGAIAASAQVRAELFVALYRAVQEQRLQDARAIFHALAPLVRTLFDEPNPGGVKAALHLQGWLDNELRPPMTRVSDATQARLAKQLETLASAPS